MAKSAKTVKEYMAGLPADRRQALEAVWKVFLENIGPGYEERMEYGMPGFCVPHSIYPAGYHCDPKIPLPFAGMASQKNYMSIYLMCQYFSAEEDAAFRAKWAKTGKKLDMGKVCIRFKRVEDLALDLIGEVIASVPVEDYIARYEASLAESVKKKREKEGPMQKGSVKKKPVNKKSVNKKQ
jgi:hypothetical protein